MASGGKKNSDLSDGFDSVRDAKLTAQDRKDIVSSLESAFWRVSDYRGPEAALGSANQ